jgi:hypothetical protein
MPGLLSESLVARFWRQRTFCAVPGSTEAAWSGSCPARPPRALLGRVGDHPAGYRDEVAGRCEDHVTRASLKWREELGCVAYVR